MSAGDSIELRGERFMRVLRQCCPQATKADAERALRLYSRGSGAIALATDLQHPLHKLEQFLEVIFKLDQEQPAPQFRSLPPSINEPAAEIVVAHVQSETIRPQTIERPDQPRIELIPSYDGDTLLIRPMHHEGPHVPLTTLQEATVRCLLNQGIPRGHISGWMRLPPSQVSSIGTNALRAEMPSGRAPGARQVRASHPRPNTHQIEGPANV